MFDMDEIAFCIFHSLKLKCENFLYEDDRYVFMIKASFLRYS